MNINDVIKKTVDETICKLKSEKLIKENRLSTYKKTEKFLYNYSSWKSDPEAKDNCIKIEKALQVISNDKYYDIIEMKYFQNMKLEDIAEEFDVDTSVISRHRQRLINEIRGILFPVDYAEELKAL